MILPFQSGIFARRLHVWLLLLGGIGALALPPFDVWPLLSVSVSGALFLVAGITSFSWRRVLSAGVAFGFGYFLVALHWIAVAFTVDGTDDLWMMPFAVGGLCLFLSLYWGLGFGLTRVLARLGVPLFAALPFCLTLAEMLRAKLFTGFPWAEPGLAADGMGGVLQAASLVGMPGLTFWLLLWAALPFALKTCWGSSKAMRVALVALVLSFPAIWLAGSVRLSENPMQFSSVVRVRLVQPNIGQEDKWRSDNAESIFSTLIDLSGRQDGPEPTHIIWPESSVPFLLDESSDALARISAMLGPSRVLLAGAVRREKRDAATGEEHFFTSILTIDGEGTVLDHYDKWRLVPGGEFLPLAWLLEPLGFRKVVSLPEGFTPGRGPHSIPVPGAGKAGMLICYEAIFYDQLVDSQNRPDWLVNVTNDGWFGHSTGPYQHLAQVRLRAVEQGLPIARAANTGISAMIDPYGRYVVKSGLGNAAAIDSGLPLSIDFTFFARFGPWPGLYLSLLLVVVFFVIAKKCDRSHRIVDGI